MSNAITKAFVNTDPRYDIAERCLRALFPGAALLPRFADDAPRSPDTPRPPRPPLPADATEAEKEQEARILALPAFERGDIVDTAVAERVDLVFLPPPGLDFDSRHTMFGVLELAEVLVEAKAFIVDQIPVVEEEIAAWNATHPDEPKMRLHYALRALKQEAEAFKLRRFYLAALAGSEFGPDVVVPTANAVIAAEEAAAEALRVAISDLRTEQASFLAPVIDTRKEEGRSGAVTVPSSVDVAATAEALANGLVVPTTAEVIAAESSRLGPMGLVMKEVVTAPLEPPQV